MIFTIKGFKLLLIPVILFTMSSFTLAISQISTAASNSTLDSTGVIANPWVQFGALGVLIYFLISLHKSQDTRMEARDLSHAKERSDWFNSIKDLNDTLHEIKGSLKKD